MKIGIIGAGKWAQALKFALNKNPQNDVFFSSRKISSDDKFLSFEEIINFEYLLFALPAQVADEWLKNYFTNKGQKILVASKGIDAKNGMFLDQIFGQYCNYENLAFLSGPSFAAEVIKSLPTALVINSHSQKLSDEFSSIFPQFIKTYTSTDVIGAEIAGSYKNVLAIAGGVCDALGLGNNARASLMARGLVEMERFGAFFGAKTETFLGLSGAGDLFLSASSSLSRNYRVGYGLGLGKKLEHILKELGEVAEGVYTAKAIELIANKNNIYVPLAREVKYILDGKEPKKSLKDLIAK